MNPASAAPTMVSRFRQRLFQPWSGPRATASAPDLPLPIAKRKLGFQASIAEFLLVNRLRARRPAEPSADVLERAARIVFVTCQNWFAPAPNRNVSHRTRL
ncbi:hypothetical protein [Polaromonas sp. YR568]|uniref:hypothetical protein n=1 Tax=Polaromonas sp. YR568 TaxID=1855301 RepID=UPI00398BCC6D